MDSIKANLPVPLTTFIENGKDTFHCDDGDWKVEIKSGRADFLQIIPAEALIIATNGLGDSLFLKPTAAGSHVFGETVYAFWHEEQACALFPENLCDLTQLGPLAPSSYGPIHYADGTTEVRLGDKVSIRSFFIRRTGTVSYVPGISPKKRDMEHHGLCWIGISLDRGGSASTVVIPEMRRLQASVRRLG